MGQSNIRTIETKIIGVNEEDETSDPLLSVSVEVPGKTDSNSLLLHYSDGVKLMKSLKARVPCDMVDKEVTVKYKGARLVDIYKKR